MTQIALQCSLNAIITSDILYRVTIKETGTFNVM